MNNLWVCLGANGDAINALGLVFHDFQQGNRPTMLIARQFEGLLDGVSYCDRLVWDGHYSECLKAAEWAQNQKPFDTVSIVQCYGTNIERHTQSYAQEAWRAVGKLDLWDKVPLVFDRRDSTREAATAAYLSASNDKPIVLVSTTGKSSPFPYRQQLYDLLEPLKDRFNIVSLDDVMCERFYDLLGIYEKAHCLIAIDSGPLHLAQAASELNVIAIVTHSPDLWHGSPRRSNHKLYLRYNEFERRKGEIVEYLMGVHQPVKAAPKLVHVWCDYVRHDQGAIKRHSVAKQSWRSEYTNGPWVPCPVDEGSLPRNAQSVGENKPLPFVNDLIDIAANQSCPDDIIVLTNDDTIFAEGITQSLLANAPCWGARYEHKTVTLPMTQSKLRAAGAWKHCGSDVFAFSKQWWMDHRDKFPPHLLAREAWDLVLRTLIDRTGGKQVDGLCAHILHNPEWHSPACRESAGNLFNRESARAFFRSMNMPWPQV